MTEKDKTNLLSYCRVSTKQQVEANTIENQRRSIKKFMEAYEDKYNLLKKYEDNGVSAFKDRPDYDQLIEDLFHDKGDGIIIHRLDRIGRSVKQLVNLVDRLNENNKSFIVIDQNINTSTKEGKLFFVIIAAIAEYEAALTKERMAEGRQRYLDDGGVLGRKKTFIPEKIKTKMINWYNTGLGFSIISKLLKIEEYSILDEEQKKINVKGIKMSPVTVGARLKEWDVKIRLQKGQKEK